MKLIFFILLLITFNKIALAQTNIDSLLSKIDPEKWCSIIEKKVSYLEKRVNSKSQKLLEKLQKQEEKLYKNLLSTKDSLVAKMRLDEVKTKYAYLHQKLRNPAFINTGFLKNYISWIDVTQSELKFLIMQGYTGKTEAVLSSVELLNLKLQTTEEIKEFIDQRKQQLKQLMEDLGMVKKFKNLNREIFYYSRQISEYKEILCDPKKIERKAIELLSKTRIFKEFLKRNSLLSSLFQMPSGGIDNPASQTGFAALQTRAQVNSFIQQASIGATNGSSQLQQNISNAQDIVTQMRDKLDQAIGGSGEDLSMPDFKYNSQRTKSFFKRIEIGTSFQTIRADRFFPTTSDLSLSAGYKVNDKSVIGIGVSHKLGWGTGWNDIKITHQGVGLRSFADIKLKGSFWFSGGYEMNYKSEIRNISFLRNQSAWQVSGLIGMSKILSIKSKLFKKIKAQLLWDFLSYDQRPPTPALLFRMGYSF